MTLTWMNDLRNVDHVLCVTNNVYHDRRVLRIAKSLRNGGDTVVIIGRDYPLLNKEDEEGSVVYRLGCYLAKGPLFYLEYNLRLFFYMLTIRSRTVTAVDLDTVPGVYFSSFFRNSKLIFDANEYFTEVPELREKRFVKGVWSLIGKTMLRRFDRAITVSQSLCEILSQKYKQPFKLIRNVPLLNRSEVGVEKYDRFSLVYLGVLNPGRGLEVLIDCILSISNIDLHIVGDGPRRTALVDKADNSDRIFFHGQMDQSDFEPLIRRCHVGVNLLDDSSLNYQYSLANKFFDYLHSALPVLTMKFPEYALIQQEFDCCYLIEKLNTKSVHLKLEEVVNDSSEYEKKCRAAKAASLVYNWQKEEALLVKIYD